MKFKNTSLDKLANNHNRILVFDCEFWHVLGSSGYIPTQTSSNEFFMPREIGGAVLTKSGLEWTLKGKFFVTLSPPKGKEVSFVSSAFASVTKKTSDELDLFQNLLQSPWHASFESTLPDDIKPFLKQGIQTYQQDSNIKKAHKPSSWLKTFIKLYSESLIVVKGPSDIEALKNACRFHKIDYKDPLSVYDVADWNPKSHSLCGSAKLEKTYDCIHSKLNDENKRLDKLLPKGEAHDPTVDASMALIIAVYIHQHK
jgi:hypothetical protein